MQLDHSLHLKIECKALFIEAEYNFFVKFIKKEEQFKLFRTAVDIGKMVQKDFWKNVYKLHKYQVLQAQQEMHLKSQQKRLESFVNKQLILSTKMAGFLQEAVPSDKEDSDEEGKSEEAEEEEEDEEESIIY